MLIIIGTTNCDSVYTVWRQGGAACMQCRVDAILMLLWDGVCDKLHSGWENIQAVCHTVGAVDHYRHGYPGHI